ncbi:MAG: hypothetical protein H7X80_04385 [bacterium]|nr:hypothetical protein [Candidatus Kapabacteria bacterium]
MDALTIIAWAALAIAALYLVAAIVTLPQRRRLQAAEEAAARDSEAILNLIDRTPKIDEPTPDRMRKLAGIVSSVGTRVWSEQFDFTPESIAAVDRAIVTGWGEQTPEPDEEVVIAFGAYVGEVLVRRTRGRWVTGFTPEDPASILLLTPSEEEAVNFSPFLMVREKFADPARFDLPMAFTALEQKLKELKAA